MGARQVQPMAADIAAYFNAVPLETAAVLKVLRAAILKVSPEITEKIAWGVPTYYYLGQYLVQISKVKSGVAFYTSPAAKAQYAEAVSAYKQTSKNALHFTLTEPLPQALIQQLTVFRIEEKNREQVKKEGT